jgi:hypothetical protein
MVVDVKERLDQADMVRFTLARQPKDGGGKFNISLLVSDDLRFANSWNLHAGSCKASSGGAGLWVVDVYCCADEVKNDWPPSCVLLFVHTIWGLW